MPAARRYQRVVEFRCLLLNLDDVRRRISDRLVLIALYDGGGCVIPYFHIRTVSLNRYDSKYVVFAAYIRQAY